LLKRHAAERRADALLRRHLTKPQAAELDRYHQFTETGKSGQPYTILMRSPAYAGVSGRCITVQGVGALPAADQALALLLFIRADERGFLATASHCGAVWPRRSWFAR
jgi:hypothetical protein